MSPDHLPKRRGYAILAPAWEVAAGAIYSILLYQERAAKKLFGLYSADREPNIGMRDRWKNPRLIE